MPSVQLALIDMPKKETMGMRIRRLREAANLTQDQLAKRCGVNKSAVSQWEMGTSENIKLQPFLRLLRTLGVTHEYLLWGSEKAPAGFWLEESWEDSDGDGLQGNGS
jgi:transcriptional regulator with XRE-family HTH domain